MKHFTFLQFAYSDTAISRHIDNTVPENLESHALELVDKVLDPLVEAWGSDVIMTSGYRSLALNTAVGSKTNKSAHCHCYAADLVPKNGRIEEFKEFTMKWLLNNNIAFDLFINEYSGKSSWVHIGIRNMAGQQRKQYLLYYGGKYSSINPTFFKGIGGQGAQTQYESSFTTGGGNTQLGDDRGTLQGKSVYLNEIDLAAVKANGVFVKDDSGEVLMDENGNFTTSDKYLFEANESVSDEITDISEVEAYPIEGFSELLASIESQTVELVKGISFNADGSYVVNKSKTILEIMAMVLEWWDMVQKFKNMDWHNLASKTKTETLEEEGTLSINAMVYMKAAFDMYGHAYRKGMVCPVCGKSARFLPPGGYCSVECLLKSVKDKSLAFLMSPNDKYKWLQDLIAELAALLDMTNMLLNAVVMIPDIIKELAALPDEYKEYVKNKIAEGFAELLELIQKAMILKNELLQRLLKPINFGIIAKPIAMAMQVINVILLALQVAQEAFDMAFSYVKMVLDKLTAISNMKPGLVIPAESFAWALTPRSIISPTPYTCPGGDMGKIFVVLPGGSGVPLEGIKPLLPSALLDINFLAIDAAIQAIFPPLTPMDYYLEPELFAVRFLFSDLSNLVTQVRQMLEDYLRGGPDYLPKFENLLPIKSMSFQGVSIPLPNIGYLWFLLGLMDAWAPHSQALVGSLIHPEI